MTEASFGPHDFVSNRSINAARAGWAVRNVLFYLDNCTHGCAFEKLLARAHIRFPSALVLIIIVIGHNFMRRFLRCVNPLAQYRIYRCCNQIKSNWFTHTHTQAANPSHRERGKNESICHWNSETQYPFNYNRLKIRKNKWHMLSVTTTATHLIRACDACSRACTS